jgi:hypothetical protein
MDDLLTRADNLLWKGLAVSTRRTYDNAWGKFEEFGREYKVTIAPPVSESTLCYFVAYLSQSWTYKSIKVALAAIRSHHVDLGVACNMDSMLRLKRVCDGVRRDMGEGTKKTRLPITVAILAELASVTKPCYEHTLVFAAACIGTYGLLRSGEMFPDESMGQPGLKWGDIITNGDSVTVNLVSSKTDPWRQGTRVELFRNNTSTCPWTAVKAYQATWPARPAGERSFF